MTKHFLIGILMTFITAAAQAGEKLELPDVTLDYVALGNGPALYILHGGMESRDSFSKQIEALSKHFTIVAPDSREQGRSSSSPTQISYDVMAHDIIALAKHLGHEKISLMGHSDGGITALTLAFHRPELVDKLVLIGMNYHFEAYPPETRAFIANYEWDGNENPNGYPGMFIEHYLKGHDDLSGFGDRLKEMAAMWTTSPTFSTDDLSKVQAPTLIINGDREDTDLNHVLSMYTHLANARLFIVPGATHWLPKEKPTLINDMVLDFLTDSEN